MPRSSPVPDPTESEFAILQVIWRRGPSSVREVWRELGETSGYTTILKFLQIMLEKGLVSRDERQLTHVYHAAVAESKIKHRLVTGLIDRAFAGSAAELVLRALSAKPISTEEIRAIRELLAEEENKKKPKS